MNRSRSKHGSILSRWPFWFALIGIVVLVGAGTAGFKNWFGGSKGSAVDDPWAVAKQGPLTISITESGTIQASEQAIIKSQVEGQTTILFLVPEGTAVKKGDLLVQLDSSSIQDQLIDQQILAQNANAALISSRENLEVVKNQAQSDIDQAQLTYDFAQLDLNKYNQGDYPNSLKSAESQITIADEDKQRADETARWSKILFDQKYLAQTQLEADELAAKKCELDLELAQNNLTLLKDFTYKRQVKQLESDVSQAKMALDRTQRKSAASVVEAQADLQAKQSENDRQQGKMVKLQTQITNAKIYAPTDGLVVYATSVSAGGHDHQQSPLDEGQAVHEYQELIYLPRTASFIANIKVHESSLEKIYPGLPVRLTIDAIPGKNFTGKVSKIAPLPDAMSVFMNPDLKLYNTEIAMDGISPQLRTGMSCRAEIIVAQYDNAVYVPVQAATRVGKASTVYVADHGNWTQRTVQLGMDNNNMVQIASGLRAGEHVLLTPPLAPAASDQSDASDSKENKRLLANVAKPTSGTLAQDSGGAHHGAGATPEQQAALKAAGVKIGPDGRPDFSSLTDAQKQALRAKMGSGAHGFGTGGHRRGGNPADGGAPGGGPGGGDAGANGGNGGNSGGGAAGGDAGAGQ